MLPFIEETAKPRKKAKWLRISKEKFTPRHQRDHVWYDEVDVLPNHVSLDPRVGIYSFCPRLYPSGMGLSREWASAGRPGSRASEARIIFSAFRLVSPTRPLLPSLSLSLSNDINCHLLTTYMLLGPEMMHVLA